MRSLSALIAATALIAQSARAQEPRAVPLPAATPKPAAAAVDPGIASAPYTSIADGNGAAHGGRVFGSVEYLLWWTKGQVPGPLVTTSVDGTVVGDAGVLGLATTSVLFGNVPLNDNLRGGGRFTLGLWLDDCRDCGVGASFFMLRDSFAGFSANSTGTPILARPFFDFINGVEAAELTAFPGVAAGCIDARTFSQFLGADAFLRKNIAGSCGSRLDVLLGYRFLLLRDSLTMNELVVATTDNGGILAGTAFSIFDRFHTVNQFHGADLGLMYHHQSGRWSLDLTARVAIGATIHSTTIEGQTAIQDNTGTGPTIFGSGFLALETNSGIWNTAAFSFVPEGRIALGYNLCENVRAFVGYNFLYWTNVVRAAEQVDLNINTDLLPPSVGPGRGAFPVFPDRRNDFWAQGVNFGITVNY